MGAHAPCSIRKSLAVLVYVSCCLSIRGFGNHPDRIGTDRADLIFKRFREVPQGDVELVLNDNGGLGQLGFRSVDQDFGMGRYGF